jgi:type I restriction enzyme, S subunit
MSSLHVGPIKNFALGIYDGPHATPKEADEGPIFLGIKNVTPQGTLDFGEIRHVSEQEYPKWTRRVVPQENDIVFSYEATLHRYALIPEGFRGCLGRRMALVRPDPTRVHPRFLHYYFLTPSWRAVVESNIISGATVDRVPLTKFPGFEVRLPPLETQKKIASILSAYDDLIENNRRRIQLLEQAALLLYKEWFVHLRFPGHEHTKIHNGVPEGWEQSTFGDTVENFDRLRVPLSVMEREKRPGPFPYHGAAGILDYIDGFIFDGRYLLVGEDGTVVTRDNTSMLQLVQDKFWVSNHAHVVQSQMVSTEYLYCFMSHYPITGHITGVAQPKLSQRNLNRIALVIPQANLRNLFQDLIAPVFDQVFALRAASAKLARARDLLLPKLMNGEVAV